MADTEDSNNGSMEVIDMLKSRISRVNSTPARGALKMPAPALFDDNSAQTPEAEEKTTDPESGDDAQNASPADEKVQSEDEAPQELPAEEPQQEQNKDEGEQ